MNVDFLAGEKLEIRVKLSIGAIFCVRIQRLAIPRRTVDNLFIGGWDIHSHPTHRKQTDIV